MSDENKNGSLRDLLSEEMKIQASNALKVEYKDISLTKVIRTYGIDSVSASEITHYFSEKYHLPLPPTLFFEVRNFNEYIDYLLKQFSAEIDAYYQKYPTSSSSDGLNTEGPLIAGPDDQNVSHIVEKANVFDSMWASLEREQNPSDTPSISLDANSKIFAIGNDIIEFMVLGEGDPVLLIGGLCNDFLIWEKLLPRLSQKNKLIIYYPPGHGKSTLIDAANSLQDIAKFLKKGLEFLNISKPIPIVGYSTGSCIALVFATLYPELLQSLTLISTSAEGNVGPDSFEHVAKEFENVAHLVSNFLALMPFSRAAVMQYYKPIFENFNIKGNLSQITCPTLIFCGEEDEYIAADHSIELHHRIRNSKLISIAHTGHFLLLTHSEEILRDITFS